jgi:hypothetical protein
VHGHSILDPDMENGGKNLEKTSLEPCGGGQARHSAAKTWRGGGQAV